MNKFPHRISVSVEGKRIDGWKNYSITASMLEPADHFNMARPFSADAYRLLQPDSEVIVWIDDTPVISGYIDKRRKKTGRGESEIEIEGRDKVGRLIQESAPTIAYDGMDLLAVAKLLAAPWFTNVSLSGARDRIVRLGKKGRKAAAGAEALVVKVRKKTWQHEPGQSRYKIINDLASEASYMVWSSADGKELVIGKPNQNQGVQWLFVASSGVHGSCNVEEITFEDSLADSYSLIMALGSGRGDAANYGPSTVSRRDIVRNGPGIDGTGLDFIRPKRLILAERTLLNVDEARQFAQLNMDRRDFRKHPITVRMRGHGQISGGGTVATIFAPNTIARVIDEEQDLPVDDLFIVFDVKYEGSRDRGQHTEMQAVPRGTVFAQ